jgi:rare lipoprotein A
MRGVASWYGEEFAGRTTANGEIFDPVQFTAAHRTLPFGSVLEVTNQKTRQSVRVRVNDRGPYIGGRALDLSYAAAEKIGLIEPGIGEVEFILVKVGSGDREPPVPFEAIVDATPQTLPLTAAASSPKIIPAPAAPAPRVEAVPPVKAAVEPVVEPVIVDRIEVQVERAGVVTRTQVAADGRTLEEVPVEGGPAIVRPAAAPGHETAARRVPRPPQTIAKKQFIVQVGAFSVEANAKSLQERLAAIGQSAHIDRNSLFRVRLGPFATRDQAVEARATLEANGLSAIIVSE